MHSLLEGKCRMIKVSDIYKLVLNEEPIEMNEAYMLYEKAPLSDLVYIAHELRKKIKKDNIVTWQIDRNINITNVCVSNCKFCNFHRRINDEDTYITSIDEYESKINELYEKGGRQVLLQGGCHPKLGLDFYTNLFKQLKERFSDLKLHALGPPEIVFIARKEGKPVEYILDELLKAGLDSLPGAGAEILSDRVRKIVSPGKCKSDEWLDVMRVAHKMNILTSATMMFGHAETKKERIEHLIKIRDVQSEKPENSYGFKAFIPWPFQDSDTQLKDILGISNTTTAVDYIRMIAISRIILHNIENIQTSWLTIGMEVAQVCLHAGANDLGSIMIEENVVSSAGARNKVDATGMRKAIEEAGFIPKLRNQPYDILD